MTKSIAIEPEPLCFPVKVLDQHMIFLGKTGSGKSSALRHVTEHLLHRNKRVCIFDPKGDWWGLKYSGDGKGAGFPVIAFGDFKNDKVQDVPINERSGKHIAELIATGNRPCMIGFRGWMPGDMHKFWIDFASTLFNKNVGELYFVGDEFHNFAPKGKILSPEVGKCIHWSNRLLSEGRGLGIVCALASQRPQKVHNDTLTSCETLAAMRVIHKADRDAVKDWLDGAGDEKTSREILGALAGMSRGEAYVWSPEIEFGPKRLTFPMFKTFDSFAPPQLQKRVIAASWADVDLDEVKEKLAAVIEEEKAKDPVELQKTIGELRVKIGQMERATPAAAAQPAGKTKIVEKGVITAKQIGAIDAVIGKLDVLVPKTVGLTAELQSRLADAQALEASAKELQQGMQGILAAAAQVNAAQPVHTPTVRNPSGAAASSGHTANPARPAAGGRNVGSSAPRKGKRSPGERILDAIAWFEYLGIPEPEGAAVAFRAGYTFGGGGFNNPRGTLNTEGKIEYCSNGCLKFTPEGRKLAIFPAGEQSLEEFHNGILAVLPVPEQRILTPLLTHYPGELTNEKLSEAAEYTNGSGGYNNPRGKLRTLGLIEYTKTGVKAQSILFPPGLK